MAVSCSHGSFPCPCLLYIAAVDWWVMRYIILASPSLFSFSSISVWSLVFSGLFLLDSHSVTLTSLPRRASLSSLLFPLFSSQPPHSAASCSTLYCLCCQQKGFKDACSGRQGRRAGQNAVSCVVAPCLVAVCSPTTSRCLCCCCCLLCEGGLGC